MGLTQKILLFASALVVALVGTSLAFTTFQADRLARENVAQGLTDTRQVWETFQADRFNKLKLGIRVLGNDPYFKAVIETDLLQQACRRAVSGDLFVIFLLRCQK